MAAPVLLPATADPSKVTINVYNRTTDGVAPDEQVITLATLGGDGGAPLPANNTATVQEVLTQWPAGVNLTQWQSVYLSAAGTWLLADANGSGTFPARGLVQAAVSSGAAARVIVKGHIRNDSWAWTVGGNIYLSETAGGLTQTAPTTASNVQALGWADSADSIILNVTPTFRPVT